MNNKHSNFDAEALLRRKNEYCGYKYCPFCTKPLREAEIDGRTRLTCTDPDCGFVFYQNPVPAAGAVIVKDDKVLMVKRAHPPRIGWWCLPAGFMEWKEHPRDTAIREIKEETGLDIELGDFFDVYSGDDDPRTNAILLLYLADITGGEITPADDALEVRFFSFDDLPKKIAFEAHIQALDDYVTRFRSK